MTTSTDVLRELAERAEKASKPDRELDAEIATALGWTSTGPGNRGGRCGRSPEGTWKHVPRYTASLDAAMTLVPEGFNVSLLVHHSGKSQASLTRRGGNGRYRMAATAPLALTAAALKARSIVSERNEP